jgi:hypothetical protein
MNNLPIVRWSPANPYWWGFHWYLMHQFTSRGMDF